VPRLVTWVKHICCEFGTPGFELLFRVNNDRILFTNPFLGELSLYVTCKNLFLLAFIQSDIPHRGLRDGVWTDEYLDSFFPFLLPCVRQQVIIL